MTQKILRRSVSTSGEARQQLFIEVDGEIANAAAVVKPRKPRSQKRPIAPDSGGVDTLAVTQLLQEEMGQLLTRLAAMETLLREIHEKTVNGSIVKEYYTTQEVARILSKRPYTVREWCRLGRVRGEKSHSGRGLDEEWRIAHAELTRIQNEGLLPIEKLGAVGRPARVK